MILFCLPYAGGSEAVFFKWKKMFQDNIELCPVELNGRGKRYGQPFYEDMKEAVNDIYEFISEKVKEEDYAIYGHSMGSLLAYELYYKISMMGKKLPKHIFFSGFSAPGSAQKKEVIHTLSDENFIQKVIDLGGTPPEVTHNKELLELVIPLLKNDFKILENYIYEAKDNKIQSDISVLYGDKDIMEWKEIEQWKLHAGGTCDFYMFKGNHFFINDNIDEVTSLIKKNLLEVSNVL